jgi:hypothetical protein
VVAVELLQVLRAQGGQVEAETLQTLGLLVEQTRAVGEGLPQAL